ncbi:hypothetical protein GCM10022206_62600 [Streptomyces chiangmaiensis]
MGVWQRGWRRPDRAGTGPCGGRSLFVGERFGERSTAPRADCGPVFPQLGRRSAGPGGRQGEPTVLASSERLYEYPK